MSSDITLPCHLFCDQRDVASCCCASQTAGRQVIFRVQSLGQPDYQHLLGFSNASVLLLDIYHGAVLTVEGLLQRHVIALLIALAALEAKLPDGEGCNVQGGVDALTPWTAILLNGVPGQKTH